MPASIPISTVVIRREEDILLARQRTRQISQFLGFSNGDTTRITTALSEVARNAFDYAAGGAVAFSVENQPLNRQDLVLRVTDEGPGIPDVPAVLRADFKSRTGMGIGIKGSRALMDRFTITSAAGKGTVVVMAKALPWSASKFGAPEAARLSNEMTKVTAATPFGELQAQNQALLNTLQELTQRQAEIDRLRVIADQARESLQAAQRIAERSMVVRERFMALTTHEFRTPLNAILGYLDLLDFEIASSITDKQKGYLSRVQRAAKHLVGVTNDFLDMAQGDAGRLKIERAAGAAELVMSEAFALVAPQAAARNVNVNLSQTSEVCMFLGDADRVRQVLVNVLGNAVSFTPAGGTVEVTASRIMEAPTDTAMTGGPWCAIRVEDTGPGIPEDKLQHVFEPFVQLSSDGQATRKGSGLGLTVSRQLALLMGGDLTVASTGTGAVFTLWLAEGSDGRPATPPAPVDAGAATASLP
jgi:signal transduction histidine kinase